MQKQNLKTIDMDWSSQPLKGWDDSFADALRRKNFNTNSSNRKKSQNRLKHSYQSKRHAKTQANLENYSSIYEVLTSFNKKMNQQSSIDALKKEVDHLDDDTKSKVRFPNNSLDSKKMQASKVLNLKAEFSNKKKKRKTVSLNNQRGSQKKNPSNLSLTMSLFKNVQKDSINLSIQGRSQNLKKLGFCSQSRDNKVEKTKKSQMTSVSNLLIESTPIAIHCKKEIKTPFKRFFQNKRNKSTQNRGRSSLSINQIQGSKLQKLISAIEKQ